MLGSFTKPMTLDLGWSRSEFILARTIGQFVTAIVGLFIGVYVDRHGGRRLMRAGIITLATALFLCSFVHELWQWWLLNGIILSMGAGMAGPLVLNVTLSKWFVEKRGRVISTATMGPSSAGVFLSPLSAVLVDSFGWRMAWRLMAMGAFAIIFPLTFLMRRTPEDHGLHPDGKTAAQVAAGGGRLAAADLDTSLTRAQAIRTPAFYLIIFGFGLGSIGVAVMLVQAVPYLADAGYSPRFGALMITVLSIPAVLSKPAWGWIIDRVDAKSACFGYLLSALAMGMIIVGVNGSIDWLIIVGFFLLGVGAGGSNPLQEVAWASFYGRRHLGAVRSAGMPLALLVGAGGPVATTIYFDQVGNYDGAFITLALLGVVGALCMALAKKPPQRRALAIRG